MRKPYPFYSLLTLGGLFLAGSCSIIAEVDRTKIPTDGGTTPEGGQGSGATSGAGGKGGSSGAGGNTGGSAGTSGEGGMGGEPGGGTGGAGGEPGGTGGEPGGMGGEGGAPPTAECGNAVIENGEQCDDDDTDASDGCGATCQVETGWTCTTANPSVCTPICGDGVDVGTAEVCDDGNSAACGTCAGNATGTAAGCTFAVTPTAAAGSVTPVGAATLADGTTFALNDGYNPVVTFEFDSDDSVVATATLIAIDYTVTPTPSTDGELQGAIITAVNSVAGGLLVTAGTGTVTAPAVALTHDRATTLGNQPIVRGGPNSGADVAVVGMVGGLAGNCPAAEECIVDADCASLDCNSSGACTTP